MQKGNHFEHISSHDNGQTNPNEGDTSRGLCRSPHHRSKSLLPFIYIVFRHDEMIIEVPANEVG